MFKKALFSLSQILWQILFFISVTVWRDIPKIPIWATREEILDKSRWFWLMDIPKSSIGNSTLIAEVVFGLAIVECICCQIYIVIYLKNSRKNSSNVRKIIVFLVILLGCICSIIFEMQMHIRFVNMTSYYFLRHSLITPEIFSIMSLILATLRIHEKS